MKASYIKLEDLILPTQINILLIEDESDIAEIIEENLLVIGFNGNYFHASTLKEAKQLIVQNKIDFIIADKKLPDGSGDMLLKAIRESKKSYRNIPLLVLTGSVSIDDHILSSKLGASAYLTKPFTIEELRSKVVESFKSQLIPTEETNHQLKMKIIELEKTIEGLMQKEPAL